MNSVEKQVNYTATNTYNTLNSSQKNTKHIWLVFHGMGYLTRYFLKPFEELNSDQHYIVAPQAPSKYYIGKRFKYVGASWLTKENTALETQNVLAYVNTVYETEILPVVNSNPALKFHILGYSQGVSIATRFIAKYNISSDTLLLHSGKIPEELKPAYFNHYKGQPYLIYGNSDEYLTEHLISKELEKGNMLFTTPLQVVEFDGVHEIHINSILKCIGF